MTRQRIPRAIALAVLLALATPGGALAAPPVAHGDAATVAEDSGPTTIDVLANDSDDDGDSLTITDTSNPDHGSVDIATDGLSLTYEPDSDFNGDDSFTYTVNDGTDDATAAVTVTVTPEDDPPFAVDDDVDVTEEVPTTIDVLDNDTDIDDGPRAVIDTSDGALGTVTIGPAGQTVVYHPSLNATGPDSFTYTLNGGSQATVTVTVTNVDDPPTAVGDGFTILEDASVQTFSVLANDTDIDAGPKTVDSVGPAAMGATGVAPGNGALRYTPNPDANGADSFTYTLNGGSVGTVNVTITPVNDAPVAVPDPLNIPAGAMPVSVHVLDNDTDVDHDVLTITGNTPSGKGEVVLSDDGKAITYQPFHGLFGPDTFEYTVSDGHGGTDIGTVDVTITADNHAPNAVNDARSVPQGAGPTPLTVLANDQDADDNNLTISSRTNGAHGTVVITGSGTGLTYNPVNSYHGIDTFTYTISDGLASDTATVRVTVVPDTAPPIVIAPAERIPAHAAGTSTTNAKLTWSATDPGSGVKRYKLQVSVDGGTWKTIALPKATSTSVTRSLKTGHTYRFRVRAMDGEGNVSAYTKGLLLKPVRYSEASPTVTYTGAWAKTRTTKALGGATLHATASTKRATFAFTAYDVGWIATETTKSGKARVYVDGILAATIDLDRTKTAYRRLIFARHFATLATHTLEIQPVGDGRVDVDGFVILR